MPWLSILKDGVGELLGWSESARKRKEIKLSAKLEQARLDKELARTKIQGEIDIAKARFEAEMKRATVEGDRDWQYDMRALERRDKTWADEFIILCWFAVFVGGFIWVLADPANAPARLMAAWQAIDTAPIWYQFGMLLILVSTLGGMRLFRLFFGAMAGKRAPSLTNSTTPKPPTA